MGGAVVTLVVLAAAILFPGFGRRHTSVLDVDGKVTCFFGIRKIYEDPLDPKKEARILMVHGMGATKTHSYKELADAMASKLGFDKKQAIETTDKLLPSAPLPSGAEPAKLIVRTYVRGERTLRTYDVLWAPLIYDVKYNRLAKEEADLGKERAWANRTLKQNMMNTRLTDPVLYLGSMQTVIRGAVKQGVCRMLNGSWQVESGREECHNPNLHDTGIAVISESLGSFIALEAINDLENVKSPSENAFVLPIHGFYMLANQLPLLNLARVDREPIGEFLRKRLPAPLRERITFESIKSEMEIVTISDPDDLLSYPISASFAKQHPNARFVNVRMPLGRRFIAGNLTDPTRAHSGHQKNDKVKQMLTDGGGNIEKALKSARDAARLATD